MNMRNWLAAIAAGILICGSVGAEEKSTTDMRAMLAPTGKLRVAMFAAPIYAAKDPASGEMKGLGVDLGKGLAQRLGVPFEPVLYKDLADLIESGKSGKWDIVLSANDARRRAVFDFVAPYIALEHGYLVRAGVPVATMADVDKAGIRVGVVTKTMSDTLLSETLKKATLVRGGGLPELTEMMMGGKVDAIAIGKPFLYRIGKDLPGSKVLDGAILSETIAMGMNKGANTAALDYLGKFSEDMKAAGVVKNAIERDNLRGASVAVAR